MYATSPSALRATVGVARHGATGVVELHLAVREPFDAEHLVAFLAARAVPGVEAWDGTWYHRALDLPHGHGVATLAPAARRRPDDRPGITLRLRLADWRDLGPAVRRIRALLDLDADPTAVDEALADDAALAPRRRGASPGCAFPAPSIRSRPPSRPRSASRSPWPAPAR